MSDLKHGLTYGQLRDQVLPEYMRELDGLSESDQETAVINMIRSSGMSPKDMLGTWLMGVAIWEPQNE